MLDKEQLLKIFKQKKQRVERTVNKKGIVRERTIAGFQKTTFADFEAWYMKSNYKEGCYHCGTQAATSEELYTKLLMKA